MQRLTDRCLDQLAPHIARPRYDRSRVPTRIVHLGAGVFMRSHLAVYTDEVMQNSDARWGILGASLRSSATSHALAPQNGLYTLLVRDGAATSARVVGSLNAVATLSDSRQILQNRLSAPLTEIVSLTITEKGYCHDPAGGSLDETSAEIQADLGQPWHPRTAIGILALAIFDRKVRQAKPFTLLSCDNLPSNGKMLQRVLARYIELAQGAFNDRGLQRYFLDQYACPCTMVDRITPATTPADIAQVEALLGVHDAAPVVAEPFSQWVIQDWFSSDRPDWESAGATLTDHVDAFEQMKLRLLNGSHSAMAYLGGLAGYDTVTRAARSPEIAGFVDGLIDDAAAVTSLPPGVGLPDYKQSLLKRWSNTALGHGIPHIAADGSQKLPQRILDPVRARLAHGLDVSRHALVVAAWIRYLEGRREQDETWVVNDPMSAQLTGALHKAGSGSRDRVAAVLGFSRIFGHDLPNDPRFVSSVVSALDDLDVKGVLASLRPPEH